MPHRTIRLFLKIRFASDPLPDIPHKSGGIAFNINMFLAKMTGAIACFLKHSKIGRFTKSRIQLAGGNPIQVLTFIASSEQTGTPYPAGGSGYKSVFKSYALLGKAVEMRGFHYRMPGTSKGMVSLIIRIEQKKIGALL